MRCDGSLKHLAQRCLCTRVAAAILTSGQLRDTAEYGIVLIHTVAGSYPTVLAQMKYMSRGDMDENVE